MSASTEALDAVLAWCAPHDRASLAADVPSCASRDWLCSTLAHHLDSARLTARQHGHGTFRAGLSGSEDDTWVDDPSALPIEPIVERALGAAARRGMTVQPWVPWLERWQESAERALEQQHQLLQGPVMVQEQYALWSASALSRQENPRGEAVVDTRTLPDELGALLVARAANSAVRVFHADNHDLMQYLRTQGVMVDAVVEDPPYDTGKRDLPYRDRWPEGAWRALMRQHLKGLQSILAPGGVAAIHIDEHSGNTLEQLVKDVVGTHGYLGTSIWDKRNPKGDARGIAYQHERIIWLTSQRAALDARGGLRRRKRNAQAMLDKAAALIAAAGGVDDNVREKYRAWIRTQDLTGGERAYRFIDDEGEVYRPVSMAWPNRKLPSEEFFVPLVHPVTGQPCPVPKRGWRNSPATMARLASEGRLLFGPDHTTQPTRKYLLRDMTWERMPSVIHHGGSDDSLLAHMGLRFAHAKPTELLRSLIVAAAPAEDALVADFFAGSGSTAHAVLLDNALTGARRTVLLAESSADILSTRLLPRLSRLLEGLTWSHGKPEDAAATPSVLVTQLQTSTR